MFELNNLKNEAILRDLFIFQSWHPKERSNSSETSSIFAFDNIKIKAFLRDFLQKWKVECSTDSFVPLRFAIFLLHLSKVLRLPRKIDARSYEVLHLSRKIILANLQIWCSKMQPISGNQHPDLLTSVMNMSFVLRLPRKMHLCRSSSNVPRLPSFLEMRRNLHILLTFCSLLTRCTMPCACHAKRALNVQKWSERGVFRTFWLRNVLRATTACTFSRSEHPKVARTCSVLYIFTSKCALRHNGVHFFDVSTSKSGPDLVFCTFWLRNVLCATTACTFSTSTSKSGPDLGCFVHFDFGMCFAPQWRALFRHCNFRNFQKWSENGVLCTFWLRNVLRATTACNF